jgi:MFS family permease
VPAPRIKHTVFRRTMIAGSMGVTQLIAFGTSLYLLAILANPIALSTGWSLPWIAGGMSVGLLASAAVAPWVGEQIARNGGRKILAGSAVLFAAGLAVIGLSQSLPIYIFGWVLMGLGMASGLYDSVFSTLGRVFGDKTRPMISIIVILGGFASTVFWLAGGLLLDTVGWRIVCFAYAACHIVINVPIFLIAVPIRLPDDESQTTHRTRFHLSDYTDPKFLLLTFLFMLEVLIATTMGVHLINLLGMMGHSLATAIAIAALLGPSQIAGRLIEITVGSRILPATATILALIVIIIGLVSMALISGVTTAAMVLYGAGIGVLSVARGTLPLTLFKQEFYPVVMGQIARPIALTQAAAPTLGAFMLVNLSASGSLLVLAGISGLALLAAVLLRGIQKQSA